MKIGYVAACRPDISLPDQFRWAGANGFEAIELRARRLESGEPHVGATVNLNAFDEIQAKALREAAGEQGVTISGVHCPGFPLTHDPAERAGMRDNMLKAIEVARMLNVEVLSCFVGRDGELTIDENIKMVPDVFGELLERAADAGVRIAIENCPAAGWGAGHERVGNIACSPPVWRRLFEACPDLGLNYDPSHLVWMGVDYVRPIYEFRDHIYHVHAKDTEIRADVLADEGILPPASGWWRYRLPGLGQVDWARFISALYEIGYEGAMCIEHEDKVWSGNEEKVRNGLQIGRRHLEQFLC